MDVFDADSDLDMVVEALKACDNCLRTHPVLLSLPPARMTVGCVISRIRYASVLSNRGDLGGGEPGPAFWTPKWPPPPMVSLLL